MELIVVIFFFSLTSAVCLQIFVKAHVLGKNTVDLNKAVVWGENAGELFYEYGEDFPKYENLITDMVEDGLNVSLITSKDDDFIYLDYVCYRDSVSDPVYSLSFKKNVQEVLP